MAKTRTKTKLSAVNNARMRAGKSNAQNGGRAQSPSMARHKGKKRQANRSPSPVAGPSNIPARSPSPATIIPSSQPAPSPPIAAPSGPLNPEALSRNAILKEGWYLLQGYYNNTTTADEVHAFLQDVQEGELEKGFADITGCEPDDLALQENLASRISSRIQELENLAVIPKPTGMCVAYYIMNEYSTPT